MANGTIIQAPGRYTTAMGTYFVFRGGVTGCPSGTTGGLMAVRVTAASPPALTPAWCGGPTNAGNPMVSMSNASGADAIVWVVGTNGQLNALNADTGASLLSGAAISLGTVKPHQSPICGERPRDRGVRHPHLRAHAVERLPLPLAGEGSNLGPA